METHQYDDLLEQLDALIETMDEHEGELYVAIEIAHHLRDTIVQVGCDTPEDGEAE
jgi:hypothetical protein